MFGNSHKGDTSQSYELLIKIFYFLLLKSRVMFFSFFLFLILTEIVNPISIFKIPLLSLAQRLGSLACASQHARMWGYAPKVHEPSPQQQSQHFKRELLWSLTTVKNSGPTRLKSSYMQTVLKKRMRQDTDSRPTVKCPLLRHRSPQ